MTDPGDTTASTPLRCDHCQQPITNLTVTLERLSLRFTDASGREYRPTVAEARAWANAQLARWWAP